LIYTEDRETFERDMFRPPHMARMLEAAGRYSGRMGDKDRVAFFQLALDAFWALRDTVHVTADIQRNWDRALKTAATSRDRWIVWSNLNLRYEWVLGRRLGERL
jgi:hypothetical protein